jgi:hypothetical protein
MTQKFSKKMSGIHAKVVGLRRFAPYLSRGGLDPEKTMIIRKGPELPHFLASSRHSKSLRLLIGLRFYTASYYRLPILWSLGNHPEEQQYSRDAWGYSALRDTWVLVLFSSLVLTLRPGYIQSTARGNSPIWNGFGLSLDAGYNTYGFGSLRRRRTDNGTGNLPWDWVISKEPSIIIRTTTGSWSEAGNTRNRLVSKASLGRPPILTPSFESEMDSGTGTLKVGRNARVLQ